MPVKEKRRDLGHQRMNLPRVKEGEEFFEMTEGTINKIFHLVLSLKLKRMVLLKRDRSMHSFPPTTSNLTRINTSINTGHLTYLITKNLSSTLSE